MDSTSKSQVVDAIPDIIRSLAVAAIMQLPSGTPVNLPRVSGIYFAVNEFRDVCYVGCSVDIHQRWSGHGLKSLAESESWTIYYKEVDYTRFDSKEQEEAFYIAVLRPTENKVVRCRIQKQRSLS
jgi:hypothetical protein